MKRKPLVLALMSATVIGAALLSSCKKEVSPVGDRAISATQIIPSSPTLSGVLGTGHNIKDSIHLTSGTVWHLSGLVYVDSLDVLIIDAGTTIQGDSTNTTGVPGGGLVITRGAKINAIGTASSPIIFTSNSPRPTPGKWSGVVILGNASSNTTGRVQVEGIPSNPPAAATFGGSVGTNDADNSGTLKYVRIEYGGFELSTDNEINGLTLGGVGSGTTIDYVEIYKSNDDAIEFFGGTVNVSHLLAIDALDDLIDTDNGYRGTISYALALTDTSRADKSTSNGFESDNDAAGSSNTPLTSPTYNYVTVVGLPNAARASITNGLPSTTGKYGRAAHLRRNARFTINNSIFLGYNYGLSRDLQLGAAQGTFTNNFVHAYVYPYLTESNGTAYTAVATPSGNKGFVTANPNDSLQLGAPFNRGAGAAAWVPAFDAPTANAGAFPASVAVWATGNWVRFQ